MNELVKALALRSAMLPTIALSPAEALATAVTGGGVVGGGVDYALKRALLERGVGTNLVGAVRPEALIQLATEQGGKVGSGLAKSISYRDPYEDSLRKQGEDIKLGKGGFIPAKEERIDTELPIAKREEQIPGFTPSQREEPLPGFTPAPPKTIKDVITKMQVGADDTEEGAFQPLADKGKTRKEINDRDIELNDKQGHGELEGFLKHPQLFEKYPELRKIPVNITTDENVGTKGWGTEGGVYQNGELFIRRKSKKKLKKLSSTKSNTPYKKKRDLQVVEVLMVWVV